MKTRTDVLWRSWANLIRKLEGARYRRGIERSLALHLRGEVRGDGLKLKKLTTRLEIEWWARDVHPWDRDDPPDRKAHLFFRQSLDDTDAAITRLFQSLPQVDVIALTVREPTTEAVILAGTVDRSTPEPAAELSVGMRLWQRGIIFHSDGSRLETFEASDAPEDHLNLWAEKSPAAILTVDGSGVVLAANKAAHDMFFLPQGESLRRRPIGSYLPLLANALQGRRGDKCLSAAAQCQGYRANNEMFPAVIWFSSHHAPEGLRLAAIVVDSSEEMREREEQNLLQLMKGNRIASAAASHEIRNLCSAISVVSVSLKERYSIDQDHDFEALTSMARGLEKITSTDLRSRTSETVEAVPLRVATDDLRIVIEPHWGEIDGELHWNLPLTLPRVVADREGLLQAFLNLCQNSHRAVQSSSRRELWIDLSVGGAKVSVRFRDSGPGIADPGKLFAPFQEEADGTGLGLYISRAIVRGYGGDLRYESTPAGSCFTIDLQVAGVVMPVSPPSQIH